MRWVCEIEIPDNADYTTKLDAMAEASRNESLWRAIKSREDRRDEIMARTKLEGKCGACKYFTLTPCKNQKSYGMCRLGYVSPRPRSQHCCSHYERNENV